MVLGLHRTETVIVSGVQKEREVRIDLIDLMILRDIADFMNRKKVIKYVIDDKTYMNVKYSVIMEDLPILGLKQQALSDRLDKLCSFSLLEKIVVKNQSGSFTAFKIGDMYEKITYSDGEREGVVSNRSHEYPDTSAEVSRYECYIYNNNDDNKYTDKDSSTINNPNKDKKEEIDKSISEKKEKNSNTVVSDEDAFIDSIYAMYPSKCPVRGTSLGKTHADKKRIRALMRTYTREQIRTVVESEVRNKLGKYSMKNFSTFLNNFPDPNEMCDNSTPKSVNNNLPVGFILEGDRDKIISESKKDLWK